MTDGRRISLAGHSALPKIAPDGLSQLLQRENGENLSQSQVYIFNCERGTVIPITVTEALVYADHQEEPDQCQVISFSNLARRQVIQVRKAFHLHPVLDTICSNSVFNVTDNAFVLGENLVLTMSELAADYEETTGIKIVLLPKMMLLFSNRATLGYARERCGKEENGEESVDIKVAIDEEEGCSQMQRVFYKLLESNTLRHERFVRKITAEAKQLHERAPGLCRRAVDKFTKRIIRVKKYLMIADEVIKPKAKFFKRLTQMQRFAPALLPYLLSMESRYEAMSLRVTTGNELIKEAARIAIVKESARMNVVMKRFAAFSVMFLPIATIGSYMGMNVTIPWYLEGDLTAFNWLVGVSIMILVGLAAVFKVKGWL